ncbi:MAG: hypothetical protein WCJ33_09605 [Pseudomonadota bacterium]
MAGKIKLSVALELELTLKNKKRYQNALNLIRQEPTKKSVQRKQKIAGWVEEYLLEILLGGTKLVKI